MWKGMENGATRSSQPRSTVWKKSPAVEQGGAVKDVCGLEGGCHPQVEGRMAVIVDAGGGRVEHASSFKL
jgi:hypothetical protein